MIDISLMAIVPCKPFEESKQRLAGVLDSASRAALAREMLERTLTVLARVRGLTRVAVVSRSDEVLAIARQHGAWSIWEMNGGLNKALALATRVARANGIGAVLILPTDLPDLAAANVEELIELGRPRASLVIAPDLRESGTNALLVNPTGSIEYAFGEHSFSEHVRRGEQAGAAVQIFRSPGLGFDIDLPEDWEKVKERYLQNDDRPA